MCHLDTSNKIIVSRTWEWLKREGKESQRPHLGEEIGSSTLPWSTSQVEEITRHIKTYHCRTLTTKWISSGKRSSKMQKSDDTFPGPLSLKLELKGKINKQTNKQERKAICNYFHNQTQLLVTCPSAPEQPQKTEIKPKPNYHTQLSKTCLLSRQATHCWLSLSAYFPQESRRFYPWRITKPEDTPW